LRRTGPSLALASYRAQRPVSVPQAKVPRAASPRALGVPEQHAILEVLHEPE
jgi:hypothetical protein